MTNYEWIKRFESNDNDEQLMNFIRIYSAREICSSLDLYWVLVAVQEDWLHPSFKLTNLQVATVMQTDLKLRTMARALQLPDWNGEHARSNLGIGYGGGSIYSSTNIDTLQATEQFITYLMRQNLDEPYKGTNHPLCNPVVLLRDQLPASEADHYISEIRLFLGAWIYDLLKHIIESR